jgi:hypothetical protein
MRKALVLSAFFLMTAGAATAVASHMVRYMSKHPLPRKVGRGFCYIDVAHVHDYQPSDPRLYRQVDGQFYFVGDPAPFDYDGQRYAYYGAHPVADVSVHFNGPVYCYLRGPHYHWYSPPAQAQFEMRGGAYWYVGTYEPVFYSERPRYVVVNDAYAPIVYTRPVVDVRVAPPVFHGEIVAGGPGFFGRAVVGAPAVSAGVYVAPPPPPVVQVGVGVNMGMGVGVGGPPVVVHDHRHHDRGKHKGWYKKGHGGPGWRGGPPPSGGWRGAPPAPRGGGWRGGGPAPAPKPAGGGGWRGGGGGGHKQDKGWRR